MLQRSTIFAYAIPCNLLTLLLIIYSVWFSRNQIRMKCSSVFSFNDIVSCIKKRISYYTDIFFPQPKFFKQKMICPAITIQPNRFSTCSSIQFRTNGSLFEQNGMFWWAFVALNWSNHLIFTVYRSTQKKLCPSSRPKGGFAGYKIRCIL